MGDNHGRFLVNTLYAYIPTLLILTFNSITASLLHARTKASKSVTGNVINSNVRATKIILTVSVTFLILTIPATIFLPISRLLRNR